MARNKTFQEDFEDFIIFIISMVVLSIILWFFDTNLYEVFIKFLSALFVGTLIVIKDVFLSLLGF